MPVDTGSYTMRYVRLIGTYYTGATTDMTTQFGINSNYSRQHFPYNGGNNYINLKGSTTINPSVMTIVWDKANGVVETYERTILLTSYQSEAYKIPNFINPDTKCITLYSGESDVYLYDMQIMNGKVVDTLTGYENAIGGALFVENHMNGHTDSDWKTANASTTRYGSTAALTTTFPGDGTAVVTSTSSVKAGDYNARGYYIGNDTYMQLTESDIEIVSGTCAIDKLNSSTLTIVDDEGNEYASGDTLGIGKYTIFAKGYNVGYWRIKALSSDPFQLIHYRNRYRNISCVVHIKGDVLYNGKVYDDQAKVFYDAGFQANNRAYFQPRAATTRPPFFPGQLAMNGSNIYVGTNDYVWKQINNS